MFSAARARSSMISRRGTRRGGGRSPPCRRTSRGRSPPPSPSRRRRPRSRAVLEEGGVAGGAVAHAAAAELLLAGHVELLVLGAHGQDDGGPCRRRRRSRPCRLAVRAGLELRRVVGDEARAEALGLVAQLLHHDRAHDALGIAGVVLDVGGLLEQAAPDEALDDERLQVRARRVERGGVAGRPAADDDHVLDVGHRCLSSFSLYSVARGAIVTGLPALRASARSCGAGSRRSRRASSAART